MAKYLPQGYIDCALGIQRQADDDPYSVTFGASIATPPWTQADNDQLATSVTNVLFQILDINSMFTVLSTKVGSDGDGPLLESTINANGIFDIDAAPPNVAMLCRKLTGLGGRYNRGRFYWPDVPRNQIDEGGRLAVGVLSDYQDAFDAMLTVLQNGDASNPTATDDMVLIHTPRPGDATPTPTPITSLVAQELMATQRRRLRR